MGELEKSMLMEALVRFGRIEPCSGMTYESSFTRLGKKILFWFNDRTHSTRVIQKDLP
jgi:hypothetical protein